MSVTLASLRVVLPEAELLPGDGPDPDVVTLHDATRDSRDVASGTLFCAVPGANVDGHDLAPDAVAAGAPAVLVERRLDLRVPQLVVPDVRAAMGPAAAAVHGHPSRELSVVGITGTNGKTTTTYLVEAAAGAGARGTGLTGTVETRIHGTAQPGVRTTPEATDLQRLLARMLARGVDVVAMEVSSHGLDLHRVDGTRFAVAVFTNLSQDHLDWHGSMEAYFEAKARLFTPELSQSAVICVDDDAGRRLADRTVLPTVTYGTHQSADHRIVDPEIGVEGSRARLVGPDGEVTIATRMPGGFNLANAAAAYLSAVAVGIDARSALRGIAAARGAPGRLERVAAARSFTVLVDYAHTPDALESVIATLRSLTDERLIVVVGAGGDRDQDKRPAMGAAAAGADLAVLTSDNPRSEDPEDILRAVEKGAEQAVAGGAPASVLTELDRRSAIAVALERARPGDIVLIAGKGHETGQEIGDRTLPFDDRQVARDLLLQMRGDAA